MEKTSIKPKNLDLIKCSNASLTIINRAENRRIQEFKLKRVRKISFK